MRASLTFARHKVTFTTPVATSDAGVEAWPLVTLAGAAGGLRYASGDESCWSGSLVAATGVSIHDPRGNTVSSIQRPNTSSSVMISRPAVLGLLAERSYPDQRPVDASRTVEGTIYTATTSPSLGHASWVNILDILSMRDRRGEGRARLGTGATAAATMTTITSPWVRAPLSLADLHRGPVRLPLHSGGWHISCQVADPGLEWVCSAPALDLLAGLRDLWTQRPSADLDLTHAPPRVALVAPAVLRSALPVPIQIVYDGCEDESGEETQGTRASRPVTVPPRSARALPWIRGARHRPVRLRGGSNRGSDVGKNEPRDTPPIWSAPVGEDHRGPLVVLWPGGKSAVVAVTMRRATRAHVWAQIYRQEGRPVPSWVRDLPGRILEVEVRPALRVVNLGFDVLRVATQGCWSESVPNGATGPGGITIVELPPPQGSDAPFRRLMADDHDDDHHDYLNPLDPLASRMPCHHLETDPVVEGDGASVLVPGRKDGAAVLELMVGWTTTVARPATLFTRSTPAVPQPTQVGLALVPVVSEEEGRISSSSYSSRVHRPAAFQPIDWIALMSAGVDGDAVAWATDLGTPGVDADRRGPGTEPTATARGTLVLQPPAARRPLVLPPAVPGHGPFVTKSIPKTAKTTSSKLTSTASAGGAYVSLRLLPRDLLVNATPNPLLTLWTPPAIPGAHAPSSPMLSVPPGQVLALAPPVLGSRILVRRDDDDRHHEDECAWSAPLDLHALLAEARRDGAARRSSPPTQGSVAPHLAAEARRVFPGDPATCMVVALAPGPAGVVRNDTPHPIFVSVSDPRGWSAGEEGVMKKEKEENHNMTKMVADSDGGTESRSKGRSTAMIVPAGRIGEVHGDPNQASPYRDVPPLGSIVAFQSPCTLASNSKIAHSPNQLAHAPAWVATDLPLSHPGSAVVWMRGHATTTTSTSTNTLPSDADCLGSRSWPVAVMVRHVETHAARRARAALRVGEWSSTTLLTDLKNAQDQDALARLDRDLDLKGYAPPPLVVTEVWVRPAVIFDLHPDLPPLRVRTLRAIPLNPPTKQGIVKEAQHSRATASATAAFESGRGRAGPAPPFVGSSRQLLPTTNEVEALVGPSVSASRPGGPMWPLGDLPIDPESVGGHEQVWLQLAIDERGDVGDNNDDGIDANDHHKGHDDKEPSLNYYSAAVRLPTDTTESLLPVWVPAHPSASRTGLTLVVKMERNDVEEGNPDARCGPLRVTIQPDPHPAVLVHNTWSTPATVQLTLHEEDVGVGRTKREKVHPLSQPAATVLSVHTPDRGQNPRTKSNRSLGPVAQVCVPARGGRQALDVPSMLAPPATSASEGERLWLWNQARLSALAVATDGSVGPRHPSQFSFFSRPRAATLPPSPTKRSEMDDPTLPVVWRASLAARTSSAPHPVSGLRAVVRPEGAADIFQGALNPDLSPATPPVAAHATFSVHVMRNGGADHPAGDRDGDGATDADDLVAAWSLPAIPGRYRIPGRDDACAVVERVGPTLRLTLATRSYEDEDDDDDDISISIPRPERPGLGLSSQTTDGATDLDSRDVGHTPGNKSDARWLRRAQRRMTGLREQGGYVIMVGLRVEGALRVVLVNHPRRYCSLVPLGLHGQDRYDGWHAGRHPSHAQTRAPWVGADPSAPPTGVGMGRARALSPVVTVDDPDLGLLVDSTDAGDARAEFGSANGTDSHDDIDTVASAAHEIGCVTLAAPSLALVRGRMVTAGDQWLTVQLTCDDGAVVETYPGGDNVVPGERGHPAFAAAPWVVAFARRQTPTPTSSVGAISDTCTSLSTLTPPTTPFSAHPAVVRAWGGSDASVTVPWVVLKVPSVEIRANDHVLRVGMALVASLARHTRKDRDGENHEWDDDQDHQGQLTCDSRLLPSSTHLPPPPTSLVALESLLICPVRIVLSVHAMQLPGGPTVPIDLEGAEVHFGGLHVRNVVGPAPHLRSGLLTVLKNDLRRRGQGAVLSSLDLALNPARLYKGLAQGLSDVVQLPLKGYQEHAATGFVLGLGKGSVSLLAHVTSSTLSSVGGFSTAVSRVIDRAATGGQSRAGLSGMEGGDWTGGGDGHTGGKRKEIDVPSVSPRFHGSRDATGTTETPSSYSLSNMVSTGLLSTVALPLSGAFSLVGTATSALGAWTAPPSEQLYWRDATPALRPAMAFADATKNGGGGGGAAGSRDHHEGYDPAPPPPPPPSHGDVYNEERIHEMDLLGDDDDDLDVDINLGAGSDADEYEDDEDGFAADEDDSMRTVMIREGTPLLTLPRLSSHSRTHSRSHSHVFPSSNHNHSRSHSRSASQSSSLAARISPRHGTRLRQEARGATRGGRSVSAPFNPPRGPAGWPGRLTASPGAWWAVRAAVGSGGGLHVPTLDGALLEDEPAGAEADSVDLPFLDFAAFRV